AAVVWGQQLAVAGEKARLLEVQVGDQQRPLARPVQRPGGGEPVLLAAEIERKGYHAPSLPRLPGFGKAAVMDSQPHTARAREWFEDLRTRICTEFEAIERDAGSEATFDYISWQREEAGNPDPGGGVRGVMKGRVFEKVGVNVSTVAGTFAPEFARTIHGAEDNPGFTATGISLVAHMANPHVPAVHMNPRFLTTGKAWFGGGADLNPPIPYDEDTEAFHARFRAACAAHNPTYYDKFRKWADEYFFIPHR